MKNLRIKTRRDRQLNGGKAGMIIELFTDKKVYKLRIYRDRIKTHVTEIMGR